MRDYIDHILKSKLINGDPQTNLSGWDRLERELIASDEKKRDRDRALIFMRISRYAALGLIVIGLGYFSYKYNGVENPTFNTETSRADVLAQDNHLTDSPITERSNNNGENLVTDEDLSQELSVIAEADHSVEMLGDYTGQSVTGQFIKTSGGLATNQSADMAEKEIGNGRSIYVEPGFRIESPTIPQLFRESGSEPILAENDRLDIDQYLQEFDLLFGEEEPDDNKWWVTTTADVLSINSNYYGTSYLRDRSVFEKIGWFVMGLDINEYYDNEYYEYTGSLPYDQLTSSGGLGVYVHDLPFSTGFSIIRDISDKFGIGTGIVLKKMWARAGHLKGSHYEQTVIYTGIPVTVYYQLLPKNSNWDLKLLLGVTADKAIFTEGKDCLSLYGIITEYPTSLKNPTEIMLTSYAGVGVGYKFAKGISLYAEPNFRYTFYSKGQPVTFFTDQLLGFVVRTGLKFEF